VIFFAMVFPIVNLTNAQSGKGGVISKSRFRKLSLWVKRSNLPFFDEIATHLLGARDDRLGKPFHSINRDLGDELFAMFGR
jgi:hypothetical protein